MLRIKMPLLAFSLCALCVLAGATFERLQRPKLPQNTSFYMHQMNLAQRETTDCLARYRKIVLEQRQEDI